jgi:hypothetical protein
MEERMVNKFLLTFATKNYDATFCPSATPFRKLGTTLTPATTTDLSIFGFDHKGYILSST